MAMPSPTPQVFPTTHPHLRVPHLRVPHLRRVCAVFALVFLPVLAGQAQAQDITATVEVVANDQIRVDFSAPVNVAASGETGHDTSALNHEPWRFRGARLFAEVMITPNSDGTAVTLQLLRKAGIPIIADPIVSETFFVLLPGPSGVSTIRGTDTTRRVRGFSATVRPLGPEAELTAALDETSLDDATVTVELTRTTFESFTGAGAPAPADFTVTVTGGGSGVVDVTAIARVDGDTATLTLGYDGAGLAIRPTLSIVVPDSAHTEGGNLTTNTVPINTAPTITNPGRQRYVLNEAITPLGIAVGDDDRGSVTVTVAGLPSGLTFSSISSNVTGTPDTAGESEVTITADDTVNDAVTATFPITVDEFPATVTVASPTGTVAEAALNGTLVTLTLSEAVFTDPLTATPPPFTLDEDSVAAGITVAATPAPARVSDTQATFTLAYTAVGAGLAGNAAITVTVDEGAHDSVGFLSTADPISVIATDQPPMFAAGATIPDQFPGLFRAYNLTLPVATGGNGALAYTLAGLPDGLTFNPGSRTISGAGEEADAGRTYTYRVHDSDANRANSDSDTLDFPLRVIEPASFVNPAIPPLTFVVDEVINITLPAASAGLDPLVHESATLAVDAFPGLTFDPDSRVVSGSRATAGSVPLAYSVTDARGVILNFLPALSLTIEVDTAPAFTQGQAIADLTFPVGKPVSVTLPAADPDSVTVGNRPFIYRIPGAADNLPSGLTFNESTRVLSGTPDTVAVAADFVYRARDRDGDFSDSAQDLTFSITIEANLTPNFTGVTIEDVFITRGKPITPITLPEANSGDGALTYTLPLTGADGLNFDGTTRTLSGTPTFTTTFNAEYTATDQDGDPVTASFTITTQIDESPTFGAIEAQEYIVGEAITPLALGATGGNRGLTYTIGATPALHDGLTFNAAIPPTLTGTPTAAAAARTYTITATDGDGSAASTSFAITVAEDTVPAFTQGQAIADLVFLVGTAVSVTLPAADPDSVTVGNRPFIHRIPGAGGGSSGPLPSGLMFDESTRVLSGTPDTVAAAAAYLYRARDRDGDFSIRSQDLAFTITIEEDLVPDFIGVTIDDVFITRLKPITPITLPEANGGNGDLTYSVVEIDFFRFVGLAFDAASRVISGTATNDVGTRTSAYRATDADGDVGMVNIDFTFEADLVPTYPAVAAQEYVLNRAITPLSLPATGGNRGLTYVLTATPALPAGLTFNDPASAGDPPTITGTPTTAADAETYTITATDDDGSQVSTSFTIAVAGPSARLTGPTPLTATEATLDGTFIFVTLTNTTYESLVIGPHFTLNGASGFVSAGGATRMSDTEARIRLTHNPSEDGELTRDLVVTVTVADAAHTGSGDLTTPNSIAISRRPDLSPSFGTDSIDPQTYTRNTAVSVTLPAATGGDPPLSYTIENQEAQIMSSLNLPVGLTFTSATRVLDGTPVNVQAALNYVYRVNDGDETTDPETAILAFTITIVEGDIQPTFGSREVGDLNYTVDNAVSVTLPEATGGNPPLMYALSTGTLPAGLTLAAAAPFIVAGTPTAAQAETDFTWTATDSDTTNPDSVDLDFTITIAADFTPTFGAATITDQTYTATVDVGTVTLPTATGGNRTLAYTLTPALPANLTFDGAPAGNGPPIITGTPAAAMATAAEYTYTATDEDGSFVRLTFDLVIDPAPVVISGVATGTIVEGTNSTGAALTITNPNSGGSTLFTALSQAGDYGTFTLVAAGTWSYVLNNDNPTVIALNTDSVPLMDTFTVTAAAAPPTVTRDVVITITGVNDAPTGRIIAPAGDLEVSHDTVVNVRGEGTDVDNEDATLTLLWTALDADNNAVGTFGDASLAETTWTAPSSDAVVTLSFSVSDGTLAINPNVTVTVVPVAVTFSGTLTGAVTENTGPNTAGGTVTATNDDDGSTSAIVPQTATGTYGAFTIAANGVWTYTLDNADDDTDNLAGGATMTDQFTVAAVDGGSTSVVITVTGVNDAPTAQILAPAAGQVEFGEDVTVTGERSDPDTSPSGLTFLWATEPPNRGTFADDSALGTTWTVPDSGTDTITLVFTVTDSGNLQSQARVALEPRGAPITFTGNTSGAVTEDAATTTATGTLTAVNPNPTGGTDFVAITDRPGTYGAFSIVAATGVWTYTLNNADIDTDRLTTGDSPTETFTVVAEADSSATQVVTITITGANDTPTVTISQPLPSAGTFSVISGQQVTLRAAATNPETGDTLTYTWSATSATGSFANTGSANTIWTTPTVASGNMDVTLTLSVSDGATAGTDMVDVLVTQQPAVTGPGVGLIDSGGDTATDLPVSDVTMTDDNGNILAGGVATGVLTVDNVPTNARPTYSVTRQPTFGSVALGPVVSSSLAFQTENMRMWTYTLDNNREATRNLGPDAADMEDDFDVRTTVAGITIDRTISVFLETGTFPNDRPTIMIVVGGRNVRVGEGGTLRMTVEEGEEMVSLDARPTRNPEGGMTTEDGIQLGLGFTWADAGNNPPIEFDGGLGGGFPMVTFTAPDERTTLEFTLAITDSDTPQQTANATVIVQVGRSQFDNVHRAILPEVTRAMMDTTVSAIARRTEQAAADHDAAAGATFSLGGQSTLAGVLQSNGEALTTGAFNVKSLLGRSAFALPLNQAGGPLAGVTLWGNGAYRNLSGNNATVDWDGDLFGATVGGDAWLTDTLLTGLAVSWADGTFDYTDRSGADPAPGTYQATLTSLHPYVSTSLLDGQVTLWATGGYGWGEVEITDTADPTAEGTVTADTRLATAAVGGAGRLLNQPGLLTPDGTTTVRVKAEALTTAIKAEQQGDRLAGLTTDARRLRLTLEGSHEQPLPHGAQLTPSVGVGLRHDAGDGRTGTGAEVSGGLRYAHPALRLTMESRGRVLLAHGGDYDDWSVSGRVTLAPGAQGQGLAVTLAPTYQTTTSAGGLAQLWEQGTANRQAPSGPTTPQGLMEATVAYGLPVGDHLLTPYGGMTLGAADARTYRLGSRVSLAHRLNMSLEGARKGATGTIPVDHGVRLQLEWNW